LRRLSGGGDEGAVVDQVVDQALRAIVDAMADAVEGDEQVLGPLGAAAVELLGRARESRHARRLAVDLASDAWRLVDQDRRAAGGDQQLGRAQAGGPGAD